MKFSLAAFSRQPTYNAQQNKLNMNRHIMKFTDFRLNGNKSPITNNKNPSQAFMNKFNFSSQDKANLGNEDKHAYESIDRMMFPSNDQVSQVKTDMDFNTNAHTNTVVNFNSTTNLNNFNGTQGLGNQTLNKNNSQQLLLGNYQTLNSAIQNYSRNAPTTQAAPYRLETFNIQKNPNAQSIETPQHQHEPIILSDQNNSNQIPNLSHQLIFKTTSTNENNKLRLQNIIQNKNFDMKLSNSSLKKRNQNSLGQGMSGGSPGNKGQGLNSTQNLEYYQQYIIIIK
eukprot:403335139